MTATTMSKKLLPLVIFCCMPYILYSQGNDFGIWAGLTGKHDFSKRFDAALTLSVRTIDNSSAVDQYFAEGGVNYKITSLISAGGSVRLISKLEDDMKYHFRQKLYLNIKGEVPVGNFAFSGRLTYQRAVRAYVEDAGQPQAESYMRFKLKARYETKTSPFGPFISFEPFVPVFDSTKRGIDKTRTSAGIEMKITRKSSMEAAYLYENFTKDGKQGKNILSLAFQQVF
jgi:hypothetical protein